MTKYKSSPLESGGTSIRKGKVEDYERILQLIKAFSVFQKTPERVSITLEEMLRSKDIFQCLVAEDNGSIEAFASFFFAYYFWSGKAIYLDDLYVKEEYRKLTIGTKLLNAVIYFAKEHQCKSVRWLVSKWNVDAIDLYKKAGAVVDDTNMPCVYNFRAIND